MNQGPGVNVFLLLLLDDVNDRPEARQRLNLASWVRIPLLSVAHWVPVWRRVRGSDLIVGWLGVILPWGVVGCEVAVGECVLEDLGLETVDNFSWYAGNGS